MELYPVILRNNFMEIRLENHTLPSPPLTFVDELEIAKKYYPGNPDPVVHVLTRKHNEIEISGMIKDHKAHVERFAEDLIDKLNRMKNMSEETIFEYASQMFNGMITQVTPSIYNMREIGYKIKFDVFSRPEDKKDIETIPVVKQIQINQMEEQLEKTSKLIDSIKEISSGIKSMRNKLQESIAKIKEMLNLNEINEVISLANTALVDVRSLLNDVRSISVDTFIDKINLDAIHHNLINLRKELFETTKYNTQEYQFIIHIVGNAETIYSIANKYRKSWEQIVDINALPNLTLTMGQRLVIPQ